MKCLFIGGPKAGEVREMEHCPICISLPVPRQTASTFDPNQQGPIDGSFTIDRVEYAREYATDKSGNRHTVYVCGDEDPLITLMNFYAEAKHS